MLNADFMSTEIKHKPFESDGFIHGAFLARLFCLCACKFRADDDRVRADRAIAAAVIGMIVRIDDPAHRSRRYFANLCQQLTTFLVVQTCVDDENSLITDEES